MDENLLGLLSRGIRHFKRFSKITKHSHADAIRITADELVEKDAQLVNTQERVTLPHFMCKTQFCCSVVSYKHTQDCKLTLMGVCCVWQNLLTLFCKLKLASVKITHCSRKHNNQTLNINRGPHQRVINALHRFYFLKLFPYGSYSALKTTVAKHNGLHLFLKTNSKDLLSFNNQQTFSSL